MVGDDAGGEVTHGTKSLAPLCGASVVRYNLNLAVEMKGDTVQVAHFFI